MRVAHVIPAPLFGTEGVFGGAERYALELATAMSARVDTRLITFAAKPRIERRGSLFIVVVKNWIHFRRFRFDPLGPGLIRAMLDVDVIHFHQTHNMMSSLAVLVAATRHLPIFTSDLGGNGLALHHHFDLRHWYDAHLHISQFSLSHAGHGSLPSAHVIYGGVDLAKFTPANHGAHKDFVLYAGRLLPHKGINYLVDAIDESMPLIVVGRSAPHARAFYQLLKNKAQGKPVTFDETADDQRLIDYYRRALCIVLPSVHDTVFGEHYDIPELLGQTLIEGMACGAPAICTAVGSLPEVVEEGVTGFVVPPNDSAAIRGRIRWLKENPEERAKMGVAARRRVESLFSWPAVVEKCLSFYTAALERRGL